MPFTIAVDELRLAPAADAVLLVRRNVWHVEHAEWRIEREAPTEPDGVFLLRHRVAGGATTDQEHGAAIDEIGRVRRERAFWDRLRRCKKPERSRGKGGHGYRGNDKRAEHPAGPAIGRYVHTSNDRRDLPVPCGLLATESIVLVAGVAGICDSGNGGTQTVERGLGLVAVLGDGFAEGRGSGVEVGFRHPDL